MSNVIHPTAIIDPKAQLGTNNFVGPFCYIGPNVIIGNNNRFEAFVSIGTAAQHRDYFKQTPGPVKIGDNNILREYVTVNGGTISVTEVHSDATLLIGAHVGHDSIVQNNCNLGNNTTLGGHSIICHGANLGLSTVVHQYRVIGAYAMVGMNSTVTRDIIPFVIAFGSPCDSHKINRVGLQRSGVSTQELSSFEDWFSDLRGQFDSLPALNHFYNKFLMDYEKNKAVWKSPKAA